MAVGQLPRPAGQKSVDGRLVGVVGRGEQVIRLEAGEARAKKLRLDGRRVVRRADQHQRPALRPAGHLGGHESVLARHVHPAVDRRGEEQPVPRAIVAHPRGQTSPERVDAHLRPRLLVRRLDVEPQPGHRVQVRVRVERPGRHKPGQRSVIQFEIVLADGRVVTGEPDHRRTGRFAAGHRGQASSGNSQHVLRRIANRALQGTMIGREGPSVHKGSFPGGSVASRASD